MGTAAAAGVLAAKRLALVPRPSPLSRSPARAAARLIENSEKVVPDQPRLQRARTQLEVETVAGTHRIHADFPGIPFLEPLCKLHDQSCSDPLALILGQDIDGLKLSLHSHPLRQMPGDITHDFAAGHSRIENTRISCLLRMMLFT